MTEKRDLMEVRRHAERPGVRVGRGCVALGLVMLAATASAQPGSPDRQVWVQVLATGQLPNGWRTHVEIQPRAMDEASELGLTIVRTAVGRAVSKRVTAWFGHAWVPRTMGTGIRHEQRLWQQLSFAAPTVGGWTPSARLRVEQRWLDPWDGTSHRVRILTRAQRPLGRGTPWGTFAYDEAMFTIDRTSRGPARGFDRNRLAFGVTRRFSKVLSNDIGYIWEHTAVPSGSRNEHIFLAAVNLALPR